MLWGLARGVSPVVTTKDLAGKLFGDRGYISQALFERGLELITKRRKTTKNSLMPLLDKILLRKRPIIETVNDQLQKPLPDRAFA